MSFFVACCIVTFFFILIFGEESFKFFCLFPFMGIVICITIGQKCYELKSTTFEKPYLVHVDEERNKIVMLDDDYKSYVVEENKFFKNQKDLVFKVETFGNKFNNTLVKRTVDIKVKSEKEN